MIEFFPQNSFIHRQAKTMEEFMIHLIRNEGIFDLFLNDDERKENERLKKRNSKDDQDEIKIPKKRGRKPRNFIEIERLKEIERKMNQSFSNIIDFESDCFLSGKKITDTYIYDNIDKSIKSENNIYKKELEDFQFLNKEENYQSYNQMDNNIKKNKEENKENNFKETDICVEI